jgi:hypothetical protein
MVLDIKTNHPLEAELKKERAKVLTELYSSLKYGGMFSLCENMDKMRNELRGEP